MRRLFTPSLSLALAMPMSLFVLPVGGAGLHVQSDRGDRSSDHAPGLRYSWMGGQLGAHHLLGIHEVPSALLLATPAR